MSAIDVTAPSRSVTRPSEATTEPETYDGCRREVLSFIFITQGFKVSANNHFWHPLLRAPFEHERPLQKLGETTKVREAYGLVITANHEEEWSHSTRKRVLNDKLSETLVLASFLKALDPVQNLHH
jgi:hypothetical protein